VSCRVTAAEALRQLRAGNARFAGNAPDSGFRSNAARRAKLTIAQEPIAIVLGCSDSRVPVEIVFDQGPGDLFVIRVAGNIVAPSLIGSVEFAADRFGTRLVVVLGHSSCGAILATLEELRRPTTNQSPNLRDIVDRIRPAVGVHDDEPAAMRSNILASVNQLRRGSAVIEGLVQSDGLVVVGAWYSLKTGVVEFLEETLPA